MRTALVIAAVFATGCTDTSRDPIPLEPGDEAVYTAEVQEYVGLRCASLDCHGDQGRALRIYAKYGLRELATLREQDVAPTEVAANVRAFAAMSGGLPADNLALLKGLAASAGGIGHVGGDIWLATSDPGYQCLLAFLSGQSNATACADALAPVNVD